MWREAHRRRRSRLRRGRRRPAPTAMPIASLKPLRKTAPSASDQPSVTGTSWPCRKPGERVLDEVGGGVGGREGDRDDEVGGDEAEQRQDEAACPSTTAAAAPASRSSPRPCGLSAATRRYIGSAPHERQQHEEQRRDRREQPRRQRPRSPAGSRASRSSPRRSGTSPATTGAGAPPAARLADLPGPAGSCARSCGEPTPEASAAGVVVDGGAHPGSIRDDRVSATAYGTPAARHATSSHIDGLISTMCDLDQPLRPRRRT